MPLQLYAGDFFHNIDQLIDGDELAAPEIERVDVIAVHDHLCTFHTIVDPHEAARLFAVAPDLDLMISGKFCRNHFTADRCWRFFAAAIVRTLRTVNIVVTRYASR